MAGTRTEAINVIQVRVDYRSLSVRFRIMQEFLIFLVFAVAVASLGYRAYRNFSKSEAGCGKGCGCATDAKAPAKATMPGVEKKTTRLVG